MKKIIFGILVLAVILISGCELMEEDPQKAAKFKAIGGGGVQPEEIIPPSDPLIDSQEVKLSYGVTTGLKTVYGDSDSIIFDDDKVNIGGDYYDYHTELQLSDVPNQLDIETSLTSSDDKYELDPKLEVRRDSIRYCYGFDEQIDPSIISNGNPFYMQFLGKTLQVITIESNTIALKDDGVITYYNDGSNFVEPCSQFNGHGNPDCSDGNPDWIWHFNNLDGTSDMSICVANDFEAYNYNKNPAGVGDYYGLPYGFAHIGIDGLTVSDSNYMGVELYTENSNTEDLSNAGDYPTSAIVLTMSASESEGFVLDSSAMTYTELIADTKTDEIYLWTNPTHAALGRTLLFYKDSNNLVQYAGYIRNNMSKVDWGYFNYYNTKSTDVVLSSYGTPAVDDGFYLGIVPDGSLSPNDNLWFRVQSTSNAAGNYLGFGDTDNAESDEVVWGGTNAPSSTSSSSDNVLVGAKRYDLLTAYGIKISETDAAGDNDNFILKVPGDQIKADVSFYRGVCSVPV